MNINAAFPGTYLKAEDLQGKRVAVGMDRVVLEAVGKEHKPVLYFIGKDRGLVLNKTNGNIIAEMYGPETDDWCGKVVTLYPTKVEYQGNLVAAIRVHFDPMANAAMQAQEPDPAPAPRQMATPRNVPVNGTRQLASAPIQDDEIPF